jgi:hypothetical protein
MEVKKNIYENGKIYTIRSYLTDKYYIGSTCNPLYKRLGQHKGDYKKYLKDSDKYSYLTSFEIIKLGDAYIELLETYKCESKEVLNKREGELIREHKNNVINKVIAGRNQKEYREDNKEKIAEQKKEYVKENKDKKKEWDKKYNENNKEKIAERKKVYNEANKEKIAEKNKVYRQANKEKIAEKNKAYQQANKDKLKAYLKAYYLKNKLE